MGYINKPRYAEAVENTVLVLLSGLMVSSIGTIITALN